MDGMITWFEKIYGLTVDEYHDEVRGWLYAQRESERNQEKIDAQKKIDWDKIAFWGK